jgi:hypothetical protein
MLRINLTPNQRTAAQAARRDSTLTLLERDRVEMILLSAAGWRPPAIAEHLDYHAATVRHALKAYRAQGLAGLWHQRPARPRIRPGARRSRQPSTGYSTTHGPGLPRNWPRRFARAGSRSARGRRAAIFKPWAPSGAGRCARCATSRTPPKSNGPRASWPCWEKDGRGAAPARLPRRVRLQSQSPGDHELGSRRRAQVRAV